MRKPEKSASKLKAKKAYSKPKLTTHGDVRKLTQHAGKAPPTGHGSGSGIFDFGGGGGDRGRGDGLEILVDILGKGRH
jgi:hypothetical protein